MKTNEEPSSFREYREEKNMWLYKAYCRIFQAVLKAGNYFMGYRMPDYIEGPGCIKRMPELLKKDNVNNILLVTRAQHNQARSEPGSYGSTGRGGHKLHRIQQHRGKPHQRYG